MEPHIQVYHIEHTNIIFDPNIKPSLNLLLLVKLNLDFQDLF